MVRSPFFICVCQAVILQPQCLHCLHLLSNAVQKATWQRDKPEDFSRRFCSWAGHFSLKLNWKWNTYVYWLSVIAVLKEESLGLFGAILQDAK